MRKAKVERKTTETRVSVGLDLDGEGKCHVATGIGFLDHMLELFAKHSLIDLDVKAKGDLHIDMHHTAEDVGITLGQAVAEALGERRGIRRYGTAYAPMDEALSRVAVDVSGRPYLSWNVRFSSPLVGDVATELFGEWFRAFAQNSRMTLHVETLHGDNNHHVIESCYKALALAVRQAVEIDPRRTHAVPSTKGSLTG